MFEVGQRVVLVGWARSSEIVNAWLKVGAKYPDVGEVYTIRKIVPYENTAVLLLREIDNSHLKKSFGYEPGIKQENFRPVMQRKTDASVCTKKRRCAKVPA